MRVVRHNKRTEAEERNSRTLPERRRSYWRDRGFKSQSHAAQVVRDAVAEGTKIVKDMRDHQASDHESLWGIGPDLDISQFSY